MDRDLAAEHAESLKKNPLLNSFLCAMEKVCYSNIKTGSIEDTKLMRESCLMLQCINNFQTLIDRTVKAKMPPSVATARKIMSID